MKTENKKLAAIFVISLVALLLISSAQPAQAFDPMSTITNVWTSIWNWGTSFFSGASKAASSGISSISSSVGNMKFEAFSFNNFAPIGFSNIQYMSQGADSRLGGDFIQATVNLGPGSASSTEWAIDKTIDQTKTDDGKYMFTNRFSLGFSVDKQSCNWGILSTQLNPIYTYGIEPKGTLNIIPLITSSSAWRDKINSDCSPLLSNGVKYGVYSNIRNLGLSGDLYCLKESPLASVGRFTDTANYIFESSITLKNGTESYSEKITNTGRSDVDVGLGNVARAQFTGLLSSGEACGSTMATVASPFLPISTDGTWRIVSKDAYTNYDTFRNGIGFATCFKVFEKYPNLIDAPNVDKSTLDSCINSMNAKSNSVLVPVTIGNLNVANDGTAILSRVPENLLNYPQITLKVRASWAGVVENAGIPEIVSLTPVEAKTESGKTSTVIAEIRNAGDFDGHFKAFSSCGSGISQEGTTFTVPTIPRKSSLKVNLPFISPKDFNLTSGVTDICRVSVYDAANPSYIVTKDVTLTFMPVALCDASKVPALERCAGPGNKEWQRCTASGQWGRVQTCSYSCLQNLDAAGCVVSGTENIPENVLTKMILDKQKEGESSESALCYYASAQKLVGLSVFNPVAYISKWWSDVGCWYKENSGNVTLAVVVGILTTIFTFIIFSRLPFLQGMPWIVFLIPVVAAMYVAFKYTYIGWMILLFELAILVVSMFV